MTGNQIKGKGFRGALRYNLDKVARNVAEVLDSTFARSAEQDIMKEVRMIRSLRPRLEKYFYHTSINFPPGENLDSRTMKDIGQEYLRRSGFIQNQYIMFRHRDAGHPHLHILVNRIGYDGNVVSDSNDFQRSEKILRELEIRYSLTKVAPSKSAARRAATKDELEMMKRTGEPSHKLKLQYLVGKALEGKPSLDEFVSLLGKKGVKVILNKASSGHISGISYELAGFRTTGTKLGSAYKWTAVRMRTGSRQTEPFPADGAARNQKPDAFNPDEPVSQDSQSLNFSELLFDLVKPEQQQDFPQGMNSRRKKRKRRSRR